MSIRETLNTSERRKGKLLSERSLFDMPLIQQLGVGQIASLSGVLIYTITFFLLQVRLYKGFQIGFSDLVYFAQMLYNSLHWGPFLQTTTMKQGHLFAQHLALCVFPILLLYTSIPHVYVLFFLQALAGGVGAFAVFLLARDILRSEFAATCFSLAYLFYPSLQWANLNILIWGFHIENLFPPLILFAFYFLMRAVGLGQKDNLPVGRTYPTTEWRVEEIVTDKHEMELNPATVPGEHTLEVGMYDWTLSERLPVLDEEGQVGDNRVLLGTVWVEEP